MKAVDVLINKDRVLLYCTGEDITGDLSCVKIRIQNEIFTVLKVGTYNSISDVMAALIQIDAKENQEIPLGDVVILE